MRLFARTLPRLSMIAAFKEELPMSTLKTVFKFIKLILLPVKMILLLMIFQWPDENEGHVLKKKICKT